MNLSNSVVFITGGASGLGAACARRFCKAGARVAIADLNESQGAALASELGENALACKVDVTDEASVTAAIAAVRQRWSRIDAAVSCAGILVAQRTLGRDGPHSLATFDKVVRVNLIGTFNVARLAAAAMADNPPRANDPENDGERGAIVNTASVAAYDGQIGQAAYSASKGGVAAMTLPLARDLGRHGIRVVAIAPGIFDTPMMLAAPENVRQSLASQIPFPPRFGNPTEFAALVEHVLENRMLNGAVLRIDGGVRMGPK
jgi:NAD(P)-dependent dehydrogenase (short-subunit alcohol dehydrogenase family)